MCLPVCNVRKVVKPFSCITESGFIGTGPIWNTIPTELECTDLELIHAYRTCLSYKPDGKILKRIVILQVDDSPIAASQLLFNDDNNKHRTFIFNRKQPVKILLTVFNGLEIFSKD